MPMLIAYCYRGMTKARIKEIRADRDCQEGVLGCCNQ